MRGQRQRTRRGDSVLRYAPWRDPLAGPCRLALLSDRGLTTVDATVVDPNDVSTANWTAQNLSSRTADTITGTNGTTYHRIYQTVPNTVVGKPVTFSVEAHYGTKDWMQLCMGAGSCYFDLRNGVVGTASGVTGSIAALSGGWFRCTCTVGALTTNAILSIFISNSGSDASSYTSDGTDTIQVRNISVTQRNVSSWADIVTGNGIAAVQGTAANQPVLKATDSNYAGQPSLDLSSVGFLRTGTISVPAPYTFYVVGNTLDTTAYRAIAEHTVAEAGGSVRLYSAITDGHVYSQSDYGANGIATTRSGIVNSVICHVVNGAQSTLCVNNVAGLAGTVNSYTVTSVAIGNTATYYSSGKVLSYFLFAGAHDAATRTRVMGWLSQKYGVALS